MHGDDAPREFLAWIEALRWAAEKWFHAMRRASKQPEVARMNIARTFPFTPSTQSIK
jgi:hypothetical protein